MKGTEVDLHWLGTEILLQLQEKLPTKRLRPITIDGMTNYGSVDIVAALPARTVATQAVEALLTILKRKGIRNCVQQKIPDFLDGRQLVSFTDPRMNITFRIERYWHQCLGEVVIMVNVAVIEENEKEEEPDRPECPGCPGCRGITREQAANSGWPLQCQNCGRVYK